MAIGIARLLARDRYTCAGGPSQQPVVPRAAPKLAPKASRAARVQGAKAKQAQPEAIADEKKPARTKALLRVLQPTAKSRYPNGAIPASLRGRLPP